MQDFSNRVPITTGFSGCSGSCDLFVNATGLLPVCDVSETHFNYADRLNVPLLPGGKFNQGVFDKTTAFATNFTVNNFQVEYPAYPLINMTVLSNMLTRASSDEKRNVTGACAGTTTLENAL
jgi:hypothetical protein